MRTTTFVVALAALFVGCACFPAEEDQSTPAHTPSRTVEAAQTGVSEAPSAAASDDQVHAQHKRSIDNAAPLGDEGLSPFDQVSQLDGRRIKVLPAYLG